MTRTSKRSSAASLAGEAVSGTTTVARRPSAVADQAMPSPWLPADAVTTSSPGPSALSAAIAPRTLNEPVGCSDSSLSQTSSPSACARTSGVGSRWAATASAAASSSAAVGGATDRTALGGDAVETGPDALHEQLDVLGLGRQRRRHRDALEQWPHEHAGLAGARGELAHRGRIVGQRVLRQRDG